MPYVLSRGGLCRFGGGVWPYKKASCRGGVGEKKSKYGPAVAERLLLPYQDAPIAAELLSQP